jgi:hypothetical protein
MSELENRPDTPQPETGCSQNATPEKAGLPDDGRPHAGASLDLPTSSPDQEISVHAQR